MFRHSDIVVFVILNAIELVVSASVVSETFFGLLFRPRQQLWEDSSGRTVKNDNNFFIFFICLLYIIYVGPVVLFSIDTALNGRSFEKPSFHQRKRRRFRCRASSSNVRSSSVL